jgi:hypothetical protein
VGSWHRKIKGWCRRTWSENAPALAAAFATTTVVLVFVVVLQAVELHRRYPVIDWGTVPATFAAIGTLAAVVVALWQSLTIRRQAKDDANEAQQRLLHELAEAEKRSRNELEHARHLHEEQRRFRREQDFKMALIRVNRASESYTFELYDLTWEGEKIVDLPKDERASALEAFERRFAQCRSGIHEELSNASVLTSETRLLDAVHRVREATSLASIHEHRIRVDLLERDIPPEHAAFDVVHNSLKNSIKAAQKLADELFVTSSD